ncbi:PF06949 family protein [Peptoanaerobacter stomatis]|uniref:PF06949 family protein n=1 Tax=Peptoanaerobacter stomatis TaxID=796937 RepID=J6HCS2_9FIRM|nr:DUF1292 domain-containing protein [Peptoanaerobacter stomatis]EJU22895.1 PF06949 family protein [Peptoanaerobacter stomatis]NWO25545.1 DUF1292 domain-containing protein [Peptostreptococcaceae bacterium oral taxon 081]
MSDKEKKEGFEENIEFFEEDQTIDLVLDDGTSMTCDVIGLFEVDDVEYIALAEPESDNILIYIYEEIGDEISLKNIENEDEYQAISEEFMELFSDLFEDEE